MLRGEFQTRLASLTPGSIDAIITDPPYPSSMAPLWSDMADLATWALRPGGLLLALSGKIELADRMQRLVDSGLHYGWVYAEPLIGSNTRILGRHIGQEWKPWLAFSRDEWPSGHIDWHGDMLPVGARDKTSRMSWRQAVEPAQYPHRTARARQWCDR